MSQHEIDMYDWLRKNTDVAEIDFSQTLESGASPDFEDIPF